MRRSWTVLVAPAATVRPGTVSVTGFQVPSASRYSTLMTWYAKGLASVAALTRSLNEASAVPELVTVSVNSTGPPPRPTVAGASTCSDSLSAVALAVGSAVAVAVAVAAGASAA